MIFLTSLAVALLAACAPAVQGCSDGFYFIDGGCYSFQQQVFLPWEDAGQFCANMSSSLAIVKSPTTLRGIYEYIMTYDLEGTYWLDASDMVYEGDWVWSDGSRVERGTPFWAIHYGIFGWSHEPSGGEDENCLALDDKRLYYFNDLSCEDYYHPLCRE